MLEIAGQAIQSQHMSEPTGPLSRLRRTFWGAIAFLLAAAGLIAFVSIYYLIPAMSVVTQADGIGRRQLSAVSALLLLVILVVLFIGLLLVFRVHRFFLPHGSGEKVAPTQHIDAWAESAKRLKIDEAEDPNESSET